MMALTFQKLRAKLSKSPKYSKYYFAAVRKLYQWKERISK